MRKLINGLGFQIVWFAWALSVPNGDVALPLVLSCAYLLVHFSWSRQRCLDLICVLICVMAGIVFDSFLMYVGLVRFVEMNPSPFDVLEPWWMAVIWACFGCTLNSSILWLVRLQGVNYLICAVFGLLSYRAAAYWGALVLSPSFFGVVALMIFWGVFIPLVQRLRGVGGCLSR